MGLTWKDGIATLLIGIAGVVTYARLRGFDWPVLASWRMGTLALFLLGMGTCIVAGSGTVPTKGVWTTLATAFGITAAILMLVGVITGSKYAFIGLAADMLLLWLTATMHHILLSPV